MNQTQIFVLFPSLLKIYHNITKISSLFSYFFIQIFGKKAAIHFHPQIAA